MERPREHGSGSWWPVVAAGCGAVATMWLLAAPCRWLETRAAGWSAGVAGAQVADAVGDQLLVRAGTVPFVVTVSPGCSALTIVCCLGVLAAVLHAWRSDTRPWRAWSMASGLVVIGNELRFAATIVSGSHHGAGAVEGFHDGVGTWFAVVVVISAVAVLVVVATPITVTSPARARTGSAP